VTVEVNRTEPESVEGAEPGGVHVKKENVGIHKENRIEAGLENGVVEVDVPAAALTDPETTLVMRVNPPDVPNSPDTETDIGMVMDLGLKNGQGFSRRWLDSQSLRG